MKKNNTVTFLRMIRTLSSEAWRIDLDDNNIGYIHIHHGKCIHSDLILIKKISKTKLKDVIFEIEEKLIEPIENRDDFILSVFQAKDIGMYSDTVDHETFSPTKKDLKEQKKLLTNVLSRFQDARGQLNEHVVKEYFSKLGFTSQKSNPIYDAFKVDVIAEDESHIIYCQVKLGKISEQRIFDIVDNLSSLDNLNKEKVVAIVADLFPINIELLKEKLEKKFTVKIWTILKSQILSALPEYKRTLK